MFNRTPKNCPMFVTVDKLIKKLNEKLVHLRNIPAGSLA
jgi:hypothetical protein